MAGPILESSLKTTLNTMCCNIFLLLHKKVGKFQPCLKTVTSLFPFGFVTFLIKLTLKVLNETLLFIHDGIGAEFVLPFFIITGDPTISTKGFV
jgi:hypothetical protein